MLSLNKLFSILAIASFAAIAAGAAQAGSITIDLDPFTGDDIDIELTLDDEADDGTIEGRLEVTGGVGDLRGLFLDLADVGLLDGLEVSGEYVTGTSFGNVTNLGRGSNLNGGGSPCPCDVGIAFGSPGIGKDDLQVVEFVLSHASESLDLSMFTDQYVGARATSVGLSFDSREGSSKLIGTVPEPGTALLVGLGVGALAMRRRRSKRAWSGI